MRAGAVLVLALLMPQMALSEGDIVIWDMTVPVTVIGSAGLGLLAYLWVRKVRPFLERHGLYEDAQRVVKCVEAVFGRGHGEEKWKTALEKMETLGWRVDCETVLDALRAAWETLDLSQRSAGVKTDASYG